jgi:hypothetical protein
VPVLLLPAALCGARVFAWLIDRLPDCAIEVLEVSA